MNSATLHLLASAVRLVGAAAVIILIVIAIRALREARSGLYYVVREKARSRGLRLMLVALLVVPVTLGIGSLCGLCCRQSYCAGESQRDAYFYAHGSAGSAYRHRHT